MDEHHDGQRPLGRRLRRDDVEGEAVLAHGLIAAAEAGEAEQGVTALLRRAIGEAVAVPYARPRLRGLRRAEAQVAHRRARVRDGPPPVDPVAGEALDDAGGRAGADGAVMHESTVTDVTAPTRAQRLFARRAG